MRDNLKILLESIKEKAQLFCVLYVEDEGMLREKTGSFLNKIFNRVEVAADGKEALDKYAHNKYDIVITDIQMPNMNGLELIQEIRKIDAAQEVIITSAYTDSDYLTQSIKLGVTGYIIKPIDFEQIVKVLQQSVDKLTAFRENELYKTKLQVMVDKRTKKIIHLQDELLSNYKQMMLSLVKMIDGRDTYTGGHSERVAVYSRDIARAMGFKQKECDLIYQAGILHDIGKVITPDAILLKPDKLTNEEYSLIKEHVTISYNVLSDVPMYKELANIVYSHHEYYDGSGYPRGLKYEEIPIFARIMTVADSFDAMTTSRIYKARKTKKEAIEELQDLAGSLYDPVVVKNAVHVLDDVNVDNNASQEPDTYLDDARFAYFYKDTLTHVYNHNYLDFLIHKNIDEHKSLYLNIIYIKNFTLYNQKFGWNAGDVFLNTFAKYLQSEFHDFQIFRLFGDDFVLLKNMDFAIDIDKINAIAMLKENNLYCNHRYLNLKTADIKGYMDLNEAAKIK
ncbi:response regulator [bacterium]|nr:response regulator [bacterium]MBU1990430.1 response regulator [bacterium]